MPIDIRATVTCSLGTLISGSINDDYVQGTGLIKTRGSVEISGIVTPAIGTAVTFSYTKGGTTRSIPRKLRVLSSFADPFRRTTRVELGCKLTYLSDLKEPVDWTAFDDSANDGYDEDDARIITLPISAASVMAKCLEELDITASSSPLTNKFSVASFDLSGGYVNVLSSLLVSECYCGYLDASEVLQVFSLDQPGGAGPVLDKASIIDLGSIGVGQLPGEAVTVSYSTLKLRDPEGTDEDSISKLNWETQEIIGVPTTVYVENPYFGDDFPATRPKQLQYTYIPRTVISTSYDNLDRVRSRTTTEFTILAAIAPSYVQSLARFSGVSSPPEGSSIYSIITTETYKYEVPEPATYTPEADLPEGYEITQEVTTEVREPLIKLNASTIVYSEARKRDVTFDFLNSNTDKFLSEKRVRTFETTPLNDGTIASKVTETIYQCSAYTIEGQQQLAEAMQNVYFGSLTFIAEAQRILANAQELVSIGSAVIINKGREVNLQRRPSAAERTNAANGGFSITSTAELELALGSATAQRRIELSMPYAPDDVFSGPSGGPFTAVASDAPQKAKRYGVVQNRLLLGNRSGMNIQTAPELLPTTPFAAFLVEANGVSGLYRTNGTSWTMSAEGVVISTDALFWGAVGGTGDFFFPVAPGITELPFTPPAVDGVVTVPTVVPVWNETLLLDARTRTLCTITALPYALEATTELDLVTQTAASIVPVITVPTAALTLAALAPAVSSGASVAVPMGAVSVAAVAPAVASGGAVAVPAAAVSVAGVAPDLVGRQRIQVLVPAGGVSVATLPPAVAAGASVAVPVAGVTVAGVAPALQVGPTDPDFASVSLLLHMDGANGGETFTDNSSNGFSITKAAGTVITSTTQTKFGSAAGDFTTGGRLETPDNAAFTFDNDFTIEMWIYRTGMTGSFDTVLSASSESTFILRGSTTNPTLSINNLSITSNVSFTLDSWDHFAIVRSGTTVTLYKNGTSVGSGTRSGTIACGRFLIGDSSVNGRYFKGYIDDLRITKGVARYTTNFTPPTAAFPDA